MTAESRRLVAGLGISLFAHASLLLYRPPSVAPQGEHSPILLRLGSSASSATTEQLVGFRQRTGALVLGARPDSSEDPPAEASGHQIARPVEKPKQQVVRTNVRAPLPRAPEPLPPAGGPSDATRAVMASSASEAVKGVRPQAAEPTDAGEGVAAVSGGAGPPDGQTSLEGTRLAALRSSYEQLLASWIERHKYYPPLARRRRLEGTAVLSIALARDGKLVASRVRQTSEQPVLDEASLEIVRAANPFPPVPADIPGSGFAVTVPIRFTLD